jgi:hypothetical protein
MTADAAGVGGRGDRRRVRAGPGSGGEVYRVRLV